MPRSIRGAEAPRPGAGEQRGVERHVNEIGDDRLVRQQIEVDDQWRLAAHAERRGVHQQGCARQHAGDMLPTPAARTCEPNCAAIALGAIETAIGDIDMFDSAFQQPEHHCTRRTARAEHQRVVGVVPIVRAMIEIVDEALDIRIGRA